MKQLEINNNRAPYIFRYRPDNNFTLDEISNSYIYFPNSEKLNDPFDANSEMLDIVYTPSEFQMLFETVFENMPLEARQYFKKTFENKPEELFAFVNNSKQEFIGKFGIACFTISELNLLLWASYANNHKGLCIQYNIEYDKEYFSGIRQVEYFKNFEKIKYHPASNPDGFQDVLFKKFHLWSNEFELRLLKVNEGKFHHKKEAIRNIIFGLRASDEFKSEIVEIIRSKYQHVKLYQPLIFKESFEMGYQELIL
ncbi:hypothetical protein SAMN05443543_104130 [Flavobacterium flevense]|uniref:DUF2971 domain-containing protein n=1 Tax=Flavobacterium flevense TaxID=983 RepID=A0A4Y4AYZ7_9FLAO|nr:hypothetical protein [Flavobacterium flevense]GEC73505.1 hypothetical protein FFL01_30440 [Flavobacterium flevense]SHL72806.1 hypothetical protein SAMN05443543_104130 [Flavobacterium flevense]